MLENYQKIDGHTLKIVACISMLIDHIAAGVILHVVRAGIYPQAITFEQLNTIYQWMRYIGRSAFPIFCFLLVEGFFYTKSRLRYAVSLLIFAFISEIPFDVVFHSETELLNINVFEVIAANYDLYSEQSNVYFTLFFGLLTIWGIDRAARFIREKNLPFYLNLIPIAALTSASSYITIQMNADYDFHGILLIVIFYLLRNYPHLNLLGGYIWISSFSIEFASFPGFLLMALYNHKRGRNIGYFKYLFYFFYPLHMIILFIYRCLVYG